MYASLTSGSSSHKKLDKKSNWLLRQYYTNSNVLFLVCAGNELCFIALYLLGQLSKEVPQLQGSAPAASAATQALGSNVGGLAQALAAKGLGGGMQFAQILLWITLPVCIFKNVLNVVQLVGASKTLAKADVDSRRKAAEKAR
ncbi:CDP-diacylglycerol-inositol 3-phosphatidyltransferase [Rhizophlyctis rosea]|nr:CDP-diacylglycerol-inositol 3-phosphatidyltransferase [Rhizophlyctis rosea]